MECKKSTAQGPGVKEDANEVFRRVWKRVMPEDRECPVIVTPVGKKQAQPAAAKPKTAATKGQQTEPAPKKEPCKEAAAPVTEAAVKPIQGERIMESPLQQEAIKGELAPVICGFEHVGDQPTRACPQGETALCPMVQPAYPTTTMTSGEVHCANDFPPQTAVPWLGSYGPNFDDLLQEMIQKELADWNYYRSLGRRAGGTVAKTFTAMAAEEWQCAKRLSAAYFLSSGIRYWPEKTNRVNMPSYLSALRERFLAEQQDAEYYSAAAAECMDCCLCEIFGEIAEANRRHALQIRVLVEQV